MRWKRLVAYGCIIGGVAVASNSAMQYLQQLFASEPLTSKQKAEIVANPAVQKQDPQWITYMKEERPKVGEQFACLIIPRLDLQFPIMEGTDDKVLTQGVGHYSQSVLPGERDNSVLSAHRDSFFREIGSLKVGDKLGVKTNKGIFVYEVKKHWVTDPEDRSVIIPHNKPVLTLTTCYPFRYAGTAPQRYIVQSELKRKIDLNF